MPLQIIEVLLVARPRPTVRTGDTDTMLDDMRRAGHKMPVIMYFDTTPHKVLLDAYDRILKITKQAEAGRRKANGPAHRNPVHVLPHIPAGWHEEF